MKTGRTIVELAQELQRRADAKNDYLVPTTNTEMFVVGGADPTIVLDIKGTAITAITDHAHGQIGAWAQVPAKYYNRLKSEAPNLLATNINYWFQQTKTTRMIRTLDGRTRAFLSNRYRRIDNEDIAEMVLPILMESSEIQIASTDVTENRLYIKALFPKVQGEIKRGDAVQAGVVISNSEIGMGALSVQPLIFRLVCLNGMIAQDHGINRYHVGRQVEGNGDQVHELFREETLAADDKALMLKLQDVVRAASHQEGFDRLIAKMRAAAEGPQITNPIAGVEELAKTVGLNQREKGSVLENIIRGGDYSRWGALNAVTQVANTTEDYDRATEIESLGGLILDLHTSQWKRIVEAEPVAVAA